MFIRRIDHATILPTKHCFDDALDYIEAEIIKDSLSHFSLFLVHGICLIPSGKDEGKRFAHAWVEELGKVYESGIYENQLVYVTFDKKDFYGRLRVEKFTRYSVLQALKLNLENGHYGPWEKEYRALCAENMERE